MVAPLVSRDQVKRGLRIDTNDFDDELDIQISAASEAIVSYLKAGADGFVELGETVPDRVQQATIMLVGYLRKYVDADPDKDFELGYLPKPVIALLYTMRDPALA